MKKLVSQFDVVNSRGEAVDSFMWYRDGNHHSIYNNGNSHGARDLSGKLD